MMNLAIPVFLLLSAAGPREEIQSVLDMQMSAWNRADIEMFMTGYLNSPEITFQGKSGVTRGYGAVMDRYRKAYASPEKMGQLKFTVEEIRLVTKDSAVVIGAFALTRTEAGGGDASGRFSLVFVRTSKGWKIVHDHTD